MSPSRFTSHQFLSPSFLGVFASWRDIKVLPVPTKNRVDAVDAGVDSSMSDLESKVPTQPVDRLCLC